MNHLMNGLQQKMHGIKIESSRMPCPTSIISVLLPFEKELQMYYLLNKGHFRVLKESSFMTVS